MNQAHTEPPAWMPQRLEPSARQALRSTHSELTVVDRYKDLLEELFLLRNPKYRYDKDYASALASFCHEHTNGNDEAQAGEWFYFSWSNTLVHYLPDELHQELRTGRNRNLITREEQDTYYDATVAILGLSVGSHV